MFSLYVKKHDELLQKRPFCMSYHRWLLKRLAINLMLFAHILFYYKHVSTLRRC